MPDAPVQTSETAAEATASDRPADANSTDSTPRGREDFDFDAIWGADVSSANTDRPTGSPSDPASKGSPASDAVKPEDAPDADPPETDAQPAPEQLTAEGEQPAEKPKSRRAEKEEERQKELADLRGQWEAETKAREAAEKRAADLEAAQHAAEVEVAKLIGGEDEFTTLDRQPYSSLTVEQQDQLDLWKANRLVFAPVRAHLQKQADAAADARVTEAEGKATEQVNTYREAIATGLTKAFEAHPSIDTEKVLGTADWFEISEALIAAGAREQAEKDRAAIAKLTAERDQARNRGFSSLRRPEQGGKSGGTASGPRFDPRRSPLENFEDAFGQSTDVPSRARAS